MDDIDAARPDARRVNWLIDLADLAPEPSDVDDDKLARLRLYQRVVSASPALSVLHVTRHLHWFRCAAPSLAGAKLAGLVTMLGAEHPHVAARHVDLDGPAGDDVAIAALIRRELREPARDPAVCYRDGRRYVPILRERAFSGLEAPASPGRSASDAPPIAADATYIVTGGTSGVGFEVARHLVSHGARRIALMGITALPPIDRWRDERTLRGLTPEIAGRVARLRSLVDAGAELRLFAGSFDDEPRVAAFVERLRHEWGDIRGVVHCAGRIPSPAEDTLAFTRKDEVELRAVLTPKVRGLEIMARQLAGDALDFFIAFTSVAGLVPRFAAGVADYASANAFVDHFVAHQVSRGRRHFHAIAWTGWTEAGVHARSAGSGGAETLVGDFGLHFMTSREALLLFDRAVADPGRSHQMLACLLDRARFDATNERLLQVDRRPSAVPGVADVADVADAAGARAALFDLELADLSDEAIEALHARVFARNGAPNEEASEPHAANLPDARDIERVVRAELTGVLKLEAMAVDPRDRFQAVGLDSISGTQLAIRLERSLGIEVPARWLVEHDTIAALAARIGHARTAASAAASHGSR